jgi:phosphoglycerate dehydrogenase-like enzyme
MRAVYVDVDELGPEPGRSLLEGAGFEVLEARCRTADEVIEAGAGASALLVGYARITREVLAALPSVGIVSTYSVGTDNVDLEAARDLGVWVCNVPDAATDEVATHALGMALSLVRHLPFYDRQVRRGAWTLSGTGPMRRPTGMTLGIVGMGRIGRRTAELARPVFRRILGCDPLVPASSWPEGTESVALDAVFAESDLVSLHIPLTDDTRGLVDRHRLRSMKTGGFLVNVSRGELVDTAALIDALDEGRLSGAALDVLPTEPPDPDDPILRHPRVMVTPHVAFLSEESAAEYSRKQAMNVITWAETGRPDRVVVEPSKA